MYLQVLTLRQLKMKNKNFKKDDSWFRFFFALKKSTKRLHNIYQYIFITYK